MLTSPTTFIVGAGASCDYNFPTGRDLALQIAQALDLRYDVMNGFISGDRYLGDLFRRSLRDLNDWHNACWRIRDGLPNLADSIDGFLDSHQEDDAMQAVGRISIVRQILQYEQCSPLLEKGDYGDTIDIEKISNTWLVELYRILHAGRLKNDVENFFSNCRFVVFNYDRCIEYFFQHALAASYAISVDEATQLVAKAPIVHVYGDVGPLPGFCAPPERAVSFGSANANLVDLSKRIRIYTDQLDDSENIQKIHEYMDSANTLVFLGFGFNVQNLELLKWEKATDRRRNILATAFGVSQFNREAFNRVVTSQFSVVRGSNTIFQNAKCRDLLSDHRTLLDR